MAESGRQKTKENIIPRGKFRLLENGPYALELGVDVLMNFIMKDFLLGLFTYLLVPSKLLQFKGFSIVFPVPRLAKVELSQKSNGMWFFRHFICSTVAETIGVTNYAASFGAKKMFRKPHLKLLR